MNDYSPLIAIGYFDRALTTLTKTGKKKTSHRALRLLEQLWLVASAHGKHWDSSPVVHVAHSRVCETMCTAGDRNVRQLAEKLEKVGALERDDDLNDERGVYYKLIKPPYEKLDAIARDQINRGYSARDYLRPPDVRPRESNKKAGKRRDDELARLFPDVPKDERRTLPRLVIARLAGIPSDPNEGEGKDLRFNGFEVNALIDWVCTTNGAEWNTVVQVIKAVRKADDKPDDLRNLFAPQNHEYLDRMLAQVRANEAK